MRPPTQKRTQVGVLIISSMTTVMTTVYPRKHATQSWGMHSIRLAGLFCFQCVSGMIIPSSVVVRLCLTRLIGGWTTQQRGRLRLATGRRCFRNIFLKGFNDFFSIDLYSWRTTADIKDTWESMLYNLNLNNEVAVRVQLKTHEVKGRDWHLHL